jgi:hypothetical protein
LTEVLYDAFYAPGFDKCGVLLCLFLQPTQA